MTNAESHNEPTPDAPIRQLQRALQDALDATAGVMGAPGSHEAIVRLKNRLATLTPVADATVAQIRAARERLRYDDLLRMTPVDTYVSNVSAWTAAGVDSLAQRFSDAAYLARSLDYRYLAADWRALDSLARALQDGAESMAGAAEKSARMVGMLRERDESGEPLPAGHLCKFSAGVLEFREPPQPDLKPLIPQGSDT